MNATAWTDRAQCLTVARLIAEREGISLYRLLRKSKGKKGRRSKRPTKSLAIYLCVTTFNIPKLRVARTLKVKRARVIDYCHAIELRRDDPEFDAYVTSLETQLQSIGLEQAAA